MTKPTKTKLVQFRITEDDYALLLNKAGRLSLSEYLRFVSLGDEAPIIRTRNASPIKDQEALAVVIALLRQTHYASNFNQVSKAINCGMVIEPDYMADSILQACSHLEKIFIHLMQAFGKKV